MECRSSEEIYKEQLEKPVLWCIRTTFVAYILLAVALSLLAFSQMKSQELQNFRRKQDIVLKAQKTRLAHLIGQSLSFLNRTLQAFSSPHAPLPEYCQQYAICQSASFVQSASVVYLYQSAMAFPYTTFFFNQITDQMAILRSSITKKIAVQQIQSQNFRDILWKMIVRQQSQLSYFHFTFSSSVVMCIYNPSLIPCAVAPLPPSNTFIVLTSIQNLYQVILQYLKSNQVTDTDLQDYYLSYMPSNLFIYDGDPLLDEAPSILTTQFISVPSFVQNPYEQLLILIRFNKSDVSLSKQITIITQVVSYSIIVFAAAHTLYLSLRLVHKTKFVLPCRDLKKDTPEYQKLEEVSRRYRWASQPELIQGIEIFKGSQMWSIQQYILRELILDKQCKIEYYDMLIELKLRYMKENSQLADMDRVEEVYKLQIQKIQKFRGSTLQVNEKCERLEQYEQMFDISQELLDLAAVTVFQAKSRCGRPIPYKKLLQLQKSECQETQAKAHFLSALQYLKNPSFDMHAVQQLCQAITGCQTHSKFKKQCLLRILSMVEKYDLGNSHKKTLVDMARYYNPEDKRISIMIDCLEGIDEKLLNQLLAKMMGYFSKEDTVEIVDVHEQNRNNIKIKMSQVNPEQMLKEYLYRLSDDYEGSRKSRSGFEAIMHHLQKVTMTEGQFSSYLVLVMSDITLNDVRSEKESFKKVFSQNFQIGNRFVHLILIGNHIKAEAFQKSKLVKSLREAYSFLQIDLKLFDDQSTTQDLQAFFRLS